MHVLLAVTRCTFVLHYFLSLRVQNAPFFPRDYCQLPFDFDIHLAPFLIIEFIYASLLLEGAPNVCQNQNKVGSNHEGKTAHFVLEVKGSNGG